ncbi:MAG: hypothetical protein ACOYNC_05680 [Bacteroidales bacterium]
MFIFSLLSGIAFDRISDDLRIILENGRPGASSKELLRTYISFLDLTFTSGSEDSSGVKLLCDKMNLLNEKGARLPAAVCVYPAFVALAKHALMETPVKVAAFAGANHGVMPRSVKMEEIRFAAGEGADEVEVPLSHETFLAGEYHKLFRELDTMREHAGRLTLKVILETNGLNTLEIVAKSCEIAIEAGADFICAGSAGNGLPVNMESIFVILQVIREHHRKTGKKIGIKTWSIHSDLSVFPDYLFLVKEVLGEDWLNPGLCRFGTSVLSGPDIEKLLYI